MNGVTIDLTTELEIYEDFLLTWYILMYLVPDGIINIDYGVELISAVDSGVNGYTRCIGY